jgi:hypothetical protein
MNGVAARMESVSARFLGYPYKVSPLTGSAQSPEVFTKSLRHFDCVTYMESVVALSFARRPEDFASVLRKLRYENGRVSWDRRNHYMTQWIRNNARSGLIYRLAVERQTNRKDRILNVVPGLPPRRERFSCIPKRTLQRIAPDMRTGDLIFFASTRPGLDVFHCGVIVRKGKKLYLRHASRSKGAVVEQPLDTFLKENRMAGVLLARPVERSRRK